MDPNLDALHDRYTVQATWTEKLRRSLLSQIQVFPGGNWLEVGSGTGCITSWVSTLYNQQVWGIDIAPRVTRFASKHNPVNGYAQADGGALPFPEEAFDLVFCHFLLLWTPHPAQILNEMKRCTKGNGWVIAFAEPDYGGRIDYPEELARIGKLQASALELNGAFPRRGRELRALFTHAGLHQVQAGLLGGEWLADQPSEHTSEWAVLRDDLADLLESAEIAALEELDQQAWDRQERILFTPTFFALGQKPE